MTKLNASQRASTPSIHATKQNKNSVARAQQITKISTIVAIILILASFLTLVGGFLSALFFPIGIQIGLISLGVFLALICALPCVLYCLTPKSMPKKAHLKEPVRPKDIDMSQLDTRHNVLLHEHIKQEIAKEEKEKAEGLKQKLDLRPPSVKSKMKMKTEGPQSSQEEDPKPKRPTSLALRSPLSPPSKRTPSPTQRSPESGLLPDLPSPTPPSPRILSREFWLKTFKNKGPNDDQK